MIALIIYLVIGVIVSFYMINFYMNKLGREIKMRHLYLAVAGPFVWPLQIIKHLIDSPGIKKEKGK